MKDYATEKRVLLNQHVDDDDDDAMPNDLAQLLFIAACVGYFLIHVFIFFACNDGALRQ